MNCLLVRLVMRKTMRSSRDYVSWVQHLEATNALKKLKNAQLENLDDAYVILMPMFAICK